MKPYPDYKPSGVAWLGDVPGHWEVEKLKFFTRFIGGGTPSKENDDYWNGDIPWVSPKDMKCSRIADTADKITAYALSNCACSLIQPGAILTVVRSGILQHTIPIAINDVAVTVNQDMKALILDEQILNRFLAYQIQGCQPQLLDEWVKLGATVESIEHQRMVDTRFAIPSSDEQQAIADYLDTETARIDALIREKLGLVGLLGEYRQSVITDLTTSANLVVPKTPTDNVFCPAIPSTWQMVRIGKYARIGNGSTPLKDNADYWAGGTFPWLNSAVVNQDEVVEGSELVTDEALRACHLPIVQAGAVLIALTGQGKTRGQVTVLRITATINQHLAYLAADPSAFTTEYLFWTLTGMYAALRMVSDGQGGTKGALTCEDLSRFQIPKPPLAEQQAIAAQVQTETARMDDLVHHAKEEIALLQELRAATIADAVLGRVDVRPA